jgi:hypothetical protein
MQRDRNGNVDIASNVPTKLSFASKSVSTSASNRGMCVALDEVLNINVNHCIKLAVVSNPTTTTRQEVLMNEKRTEHLCSSQHIECNDIRRGNGNASSLHNGRENAIKRPAKLTVEVVSSAALDATGLVTRSLVERS